MFPVSAIALIGIAVASVFFWVRQLSGPRVHSGALQASQPTIDDQLMAELEALQAVMHRKPPRPIMMAIAIIVLQVIGFACVTYLFIVTVLPPVAVSMTMVFYALLPLFFAFGLWEGRQRAWRSIMVTCGGTIAALPSLANDVLTKVFAGYELVCIVIGVAWQLAVIVPLWMPAARAWCRSTA